MNEIINGSHSDNHIIFAHGAGAAMDTLFMNYFAEGLTENNNTMSDASDHWQVIRFEFPYMQQRRKNHIKRPPNGQQILLQSWRQNIERFRANGKLILAGKSMGGRMASLLADEAEVDGLIIFGYPFHPQKKTEKTRTAHLKNIKTKTLILQGERDSMGNREDVATYALHKNIEVFWLADGDHSFKPRKKSGFTQAQNWQMALSKSQMFLAGIK